MNLLRLNLCGRTVESPDEVYRWTLELEAAGTLLDDHTELLAAVSCQHWIS